MSQVPHCPRCTAQLRRDQPMGSVCDPCGKAGRGVLLPPEFFAPEPVRAALAACDFGVFFRQVRRYQNWSQSGGSWVDRRDFVSSTAALAFSAAGAARLDIDRLVALLYPDAHATGPTRIGAADVAALEHSTLEYERSNATHGGGVARETAVAQLRAVVPLLTATMDDAVRPRLYTAATHLAMRAGWLEFDVEHHDAARRVWTVGLEIARSIEHPLTTDLTGHTLGMMFQQAWHLGRLDEARKFLQLGSAVGAGRHPVSPSTTTMLATDAAFMHAAHSQVTECQRALGEAEDDFGRINPADTTSWNGAAFDSPVKLTTAQGSVYYELARRGGDPRLRDQAVTLLAQALDNPRPVTRARYLPDLAGAHALAGDVDTAVLLGHQAVGTLTGMSSRRLYARLGIPHGVLEPLRASPSVADLRDRLATATAA